jgi:putative SOS response-associated peptidase YedK
MCGRYQLDEDMKEIIERFDIKSIFKDAGRKIGEIFPTDRAPVIVRSEEETALKIFRWGIRPSFMDRDIINTRRESLFTKKMFTGAINSSRCLIPANSFYEWQRVDDRKIKRRIYMEDENIMAFAGIYMFAREPKEDGLVWSYSIITKEAAGEVLDIHGRMPVILRKEDELLWLDESLRKEEIESMIERACTDLKIA